jgi:3'(2'), 5'-bisphosphate nucleotidase
MTIDLAKPEAAFAVAAARQAGQAARLVQSELVETAMQKDDRSPVTVADFAAQALVARRCAEQFPDMPLVAEEDAAELRTEEATDTRRHVSRYVSRFVPEASESTVCDWIDRGNGNPGPRFWVLDPVDGTKGFLRKEQYAIALALIEDNAVQLGVLACPNLAEDCSPDPLRAGCLIVASRGEGAWLSALDGGPFMRLEASKQDDPRHARVLRSAESGHTNVGRIDRICDAMGVEAEPVRMDSQAKYALLAAGKGELLFRLLSSKQPDYREKIWDQAAGSLVVEEAGGRITDLDGKPLDFSAGKTLANNRGVLASNGPLHEAALEALRTVK